MKKVTGQFFLFMFVFVGVFLSPRVDVQAAKANYEVKNLQSDFMVREDAKVYVEQKVEVEYKTAGKGLVLEIPIKETRKTQVKGITRTYPYKRKVSNLTVEGENFTTEVKGSTQRVYIGDKSHGTLGVKDYTISYTLDLGDDRIKSYDLFYYDIVNESWGAPVAKTQFSITFEKPVNLEQIKFYDDSKKTTTKVEGSKVSGTTTAPQLSVSLQLPKNYYVGARTYNIWPILGLCIILIGLLAFIIWRLLRAIKDKNIETTLESYPPEVISSAEARYIVEGEVDNRDILSLLAWFANRGYLTVTGVGDAITMQKKREIEEGAPKYQKLFFQGLFAQSDSVTFEELEGEFAHSCEEARTSLKEYFRGERKLVKKGKLLTTNILLVAAALVTGIILVINGEGMDARLLLLGGGLGMTLLVGGLWTNMMWKGLTFMGRAKLAASYAVTTIVYVVLGGWYVGRNTFLPAGIVIIILLVGYLAVMLAASIYQFTDYKIEMAGKLLGLKRFIKTAKTDKLQKIMQEDALYFYEIVPYAWVFGSLERWMKHFDTIKLQAPVWYEEDATEDFSAIALIRQLNEACEQLLYQAGKEEVVNPKPANKEIIDVSNVELSIEPSTEPKNLDK